MRDKINRVILILTVVFSMFMLGGCQLAGEEAEDASEADKMVGVYITREHLDLFDMDTYLQDNSGKLSDGGEVKPDEGETGKYSGRLYAEVKEGPEEGRREYVFPGVDGIRFFEAVVEEEYGDCVYFYSGPELSDTKLQSGDSEILETTVYVDETSHCVFYVNPVYQTAEGEIYLVEGQGISGNLEDGCEFSTKLEEKRTETVDGETQEHSFSVTVKIAGRMQAERFQILQMDAENNVIGEDIWKADEEIPDSLKINEKTEYLICNSYLKGNNNETRVERSLTGAEENGLTLYVPGEGNYILEKTIEILRQQD